MTISQDFFFERSTVIIYFESHTKSIRLIYKMIESI